MTAKHYLEWDRIAVVAATIVMLFLFTRSVPFPASTFWDLTIARDFDLNVGSAVFPELIALKIADSGPSLLGLKAVYHIAFFILCCIPCFWVFKSREVLPGVFLAAIFALTMESFLSLRMMLFLIFTALLLTMLDNNRMAGKFGGVLAVIFGAAAGLTLNCWILLLLVACHAFYNDKYSLTLFGCALAGIMLSPEGAAVSVNIDNVVNWRLLPSVDIQLMYMLAGMFLFINLVSLHKLGYEDVPDLLFYAATGFIALIVPSMVPLFVFMGLFVAIKCFAEQKPLSMCAHLLGMALLTLMIHLFLFINPFGFKLNTSVRGQLGKIAPFMEGITEETVLFNHEIGELAWKGFVTVNEEDVRQIYSYPLWRIVKKANGDFSIEPDGISSNGGSESDDQSSDN